MQDGDDEFDDPMMACAIQIQIQLQTAPKAYVCYHCHSVSPCYTTFGHNHTPPPKKLGGYIGFTLSVCLSFCPLTFRVRPVASTVQDGFFPYLVQ